MSLSDHSMDTEPIVSSDAPTIASQPEQRLASEPATGSSAGLATEPKIEPTSGPTIESTAEPTIGPNKDPVTGPTTGSASASAPTTNTTPAAASATTSGEGGNCEDGTNEKHPKQSAPTLSKNNILEAIEDFDSSIPDAVVHHFLNCSGIQTSDQRIVRLIAVAAQKFIHDIVSDSLQHCKLRGVQSKKTKDKKYTLAIEDLAVALAEYGIEVRRQQYIN